MGAAILAGIDARQWAGVELFTRNGTAVSAPALASLHDGGHYPDLMNLLNGWGTSRTFSSILAAQWSGSGALAASINGDGLMTITRTGGAGTMTLTPGTSDPWGWGGVTASVGGVLTASRPWTRGPFHADTSAQFQIVEGAVTETPIPLYGSVVHSLPTYLSASGWVDGDAVVQTLEEWDNAANDATERFRWGIDANGRVFSSWPTSFGSHTPSWSSESFKRALGFTGSEAAVSSSGVYLYTATYAPIGVLLIRSGLRVLDFSRGHIGSTVELGSGRVSGRSNALYREVQVTADLIGGIGVTESASGYSDECEAYLYRVSQYLYPGARVTIMPRWDEPRTGKSRLHQIATQATVAVESPLITSLAGGALGRRRGIVAPGQDGAVLSFAEGKPRQRAGLSLKVRLLDG